MLKLAFSEQEPYVTFECYSSQQHKSTRSWIISLSKPKDSASINEVTSMKTELSAMYQKAISTTYHCGEWVITNTWEKASSFTTWKGIILTTMSLAFAHEQYKQHTCHVEWQHSTPIQIWLKPHLTKRNWQYLMAKITYVCSTRMFSKGQMAAEAIVEVLSTLEVRSILDLFQQFTFGPVFLLVFLRPGVYNCNPS